MLRPISLLPSFGAIHLQDLFDLNNWFNSIKWLAHRTDTYEQAKIQDLQGFVFYLN